MIVSEAKNLNIRVVPFRSNPAKNPLRRSKPCNNIAKYKRSRFRYMDVPIRRSDSFDVNPMMKVSRAISKANVVSLMFSKDFAFSESEAMDSLLSLSVCYLKSLNNMGKVDRSDNESQQDVKFRGILDIDENHLEGVPITGELLSCICLSLAMKMTDDSVKSMYMGSKEKLLNIAYLEVKALLALGDKLMAPYEKQISPSDSYNMECKVKF